MALGDVRRGIEQLSRTKGWDPQALLGGAHPPPTMNNPVGLGMPDTTPEPGEVPMPALPDPGIPSLTRRRGNPTPGE